MDDVLLRKKILSEEFDYQSLLAALSDYKAPRQKIHHLLKNNIIIRVKKGLYVFGPDYAKHPYCKELLANWIYGPSYVSLEWALSYYGLIPERVETVTSITSHKNKFYNCPIGTFSYQHLDKSKYSLGLSLKKSENDVPFLIASPEKALVDIIYFRFKSRDKLKPEDILNNLRIDRKQLQELWSRKLWCKIVESYANKNIKQMTKFLKTEL